MSWSIREADIIATEITKDVKGEEDKMDQTRRSFIQKTTVLAVGIAADLPSGLAASRMIRAHGPVDIWGYFLSKQPVVFSRCTLSSDEYQDLFRIRVMEDHGGRDTAELPLSSIRKAVQCGTRWPGEQMVCLTMTKEKKESMPLCVVAEQGKVFFTFGNWPPIWMKLEEVKRVL